MNLLPLIAEDVHAAAVHGSWCPKLCNHACPVLAATGRNDAVPWGFHRTVADLADGRTDAATASSHLVACSGCLGCQVPCEFDQDVATQVRAGRAAVAGAGHAVHGAAAGRAAVEAGRSPFGVTAPDLPAPSATPDVTVVVGCRDDADVVGALASLLEAAGRAAVFVQPDGCCGAALRDLGAATDADRQRTALLEHLGDGQVIALDPHCLPELAGMDALDALTFLDGLVAEGALTFEAEATADAVTYHDPCLLARATTPVMVAPRRLLAAAGYAVVEPEGSGQHTVCSGAGLALELVDPDAAEATADRRRAQLSAGASTTATACSGARRRLSAEGTEVRDLLDLLSARLPRTEP